MASASHELKDPDDLRSMPCVALQACSQHDPELVGPVPVVNDGVRSSHHVVGVFNMQVHQLVGTRQIVVHARAKGLLSRSTAHAIDAKADEIVANEQIEVASRWPVKQ